MQKSAARGVCGVGLMMGQKENRLCWSVSSSLDKADV